MFRLPLFLGVMIFLIGVNTYGWRAAGVNHVLIFEINPRDHLSAFQLMGIGSFVCVWWLVSLLGFFVTHHYWSEKYAFLWPVAATGILVLYTLNPFKVFQYSSRKWFLGIMRRVVFAPAYPVAFPDFWIADQWTSLGGVLLDAEFTVCFFIFDWGVSPSTVHATKFAPVFAMGSALLLPSCLHGFVLLNAFVVTETQGKLFRILSMLANTPLEYSRCSSLLFIISTKKMTVSPKWEPTLVCGLFPSLPSLDISCGGICTWIGA
eukprot:m.20768 g.20768  ORF g.20768 m.20768 type:complete len:263 (+) comp28080_c0_seq1:1220-2008(+)